MRNVGRHPAGFRFLIVLLLLLGIFFRFVNLGGKVYWHDEAYTSVRISGYNWTEVLHKVFDGRVIGVEDLAKFQRPNSEKTLIDTIKTLAIDDAQHPPLYYVMARLWMQMFGGSSDIKTAPLQIRSLSALISLLVFPCVYWLCLELFESPLVGWWAMALIAISPVHILYAQEAREYALWTVTILLSSAALLRAMRRTDEINSLSTWGIYAATLALGFYTFPFTGLVAIGHGIYVLAMEKFRWTKKAIAFLLASAAGIIAFAPWIVVVITNFSQVQRTTGWMGDIKVPLLSMIKTWGLHVSRIFVDWEFGFDSLFTYLIPPIFVIMVAYCLYFVYRQSSKQVWVFIFTLVGVTSLALILPDLIFGGIRSASNRYLIPCVLGIQLAVAYLLATKIAEANLLERRIWQAIMTVLFHVELCLARSHLLHLLRGLR